MSNINILVVEDEDSEFNHYSDWVDDFNDEDRGISINLVRARTSEAAHTGLQNNIFHGAIVDLNLYEDNHGERASGNKVIKEILEEYRIPVVVVSGDTSNLEIGDSITHGSEFFKIHVRDEVTDEQIFNSLVEINKTGILNIIGGKGLIEEKLSQVFWSHLSNHLQAWIPSKEGTEKSLLRYTLNHLLAYLDVAEVGNGNDSYHNAEFYIKPWIKPYLSSGDIVCNGDERYLLLSPACDVEIRSFSDDSFEINASSLVLGKIDPISRESFIENRVIAEGDNGDARNKKFDEVIKGGNPRILFLPDYLEIDAGIVNLQKLKTVDKETYVSYKRVATVSKEYLKEIQSKFSSYYARPGQPDLDKKALLKKHKSKLTNSA